MPDTVLSVPRVHLLPEAFLDALVRLIDPVLCSHGAFLFFSTSNLAFKMLYYNDLLSLSLSLSPPHFSPLNYWLFEALLGPTTETGKVNPKIGLLSE